MDNKGKGLLAAGKDILQGFRSLVFTRLHAAHPPDQRRHLTRLRCLYRVSIRAVQQDLRATVVDMGLQGMKVEVPQRLPAGALVSVRYLGSGTGRAFALDAVTCRVMWCRKKRFLKTIEVGLAYQDTDANMEKSWVKYILRQIGFDIQSILDRRKAVRVHALLRADVTAAEGHGPPAEATVMNLGAGGALVETGQRVPLGRQVLLETGPYLSHDVLGCRGEVMQCVQSAETGRWMLGIRFSGMGEKQVHLLGEYLRTLLSESVE
ncbi:MAG: PilZ domain-containing protein [Armatimonadetes bacterium]|nr:PilZ domain-containing protein [Armatimonadota bacterium]